jgi:hypothetical protein
LVAQLPVEGMAVMPLAAQHCLLSMGQRKELQTLLVHRLRQTLELVGTGLAKAEPEQVVLEALGSA